MDKAATLCLESLKCGHKLVICGNGGSAAEAQHLVGELVGRYKGSRRTRVRAVYAFLDEMESAEGMTDPVSEIRKLIGGG